MVCVHVPKCTGRTGGVVCVSVFVCVRVDVCVEKTLFVTGCVHSRGPETILSGVRLSGLTSDQLWSRCGRSCELSVPQTPDDPGRS